MKNLLIIPVLLLLSFQQGSESVKQMSLTFNSRILEKGKYVAVEGEVYFRKKDGLLTTRLKRPFENITIINSVGEMKIYDPADNTIVQNYTSLNSSESSYLWHFLNGSYHDLGYAKAGYVIRSSKIEDGLMITTWVPKAGYSTPISSIELVHEKTLPIFVSFRNNRNKFLGKIFFSAYQKIGDVQFPTRITEIMYKEKADSVITTKNYMDPRINAKVDLKYLDYKIPANAKIINPK
jgi:outer membrane lipoprotein-sorting protein